MSPGRTAWLTWRSRIGVTSVLNKGGAPKVMQDTRRISGHGPVPKLAPHLLPFVQRKMGLLPPYIPRFLLVKNWLKSNAATAPPAEWPVKMISTSLPTDPLRNDLSCSVKTGASALALSANPRCTSRGCPGSETMSCASHRQRRRLSQDVAA
jgi:hypothetical protein